MKPTKKDQKKFDLDLTFGEIREDKIRDMLENKKIEVKSERGMWMDTGNICICLLYTSPSPRDRG